MSGVEKIIEALDALNSGDSETMHWVADALLLDALRALDAAPVADAYKRVVERADFWATA